MAKPYKNKSIWLTSTMDVIPNLANLIENILQCIF